ncbi:hypothetical protein PVAND_007465 [Polypedilum vanderplanki]|uniref:Amino acid transporter transmembrane domain-containing protein n=1 Tax=Polypedilum vanderplanki TaxID=319348 RepID=A0A9J6C7W4_POLVA|nr:hypothetical protein PVAND_007465 [Polypedilum vanderplanki]
MELNNNPIRDEELETAIALVPKKEASKKEEDYDPHKHRNVAHPTSNFDTLAHLLKGCLGTGILAMHEAFRNAGWLNGLISMALIGFVCTYCFQILIKAQYALCKKHRRPILSYPESMKLALEQGPAALKWIAPSAVIVTDGFLIIYQLGVCICYIVFVAANVQLIVKEFYQFYDIKYIMLWIFIPMLAINCIKNLKILAPFSTAANAITFVGLGLVLYYVFDDLPSLSERPAFGPIESYPLYFGTVLFALEAVGVFIALEANMEKPKNFVSKFGVLNSGMTIVTILYGFVGFFGYLKYGEKSKDSITLSLPAGLVPIITQGLFTFAIFISYALQCYVPISIIWENYCSDEMKKSNHSDKYLLILRLLTTIFTFIIAAAVPHLGLFISLFGAFCLSILGLGFPAIMEICVLWPDKFGKLNWHLWKDIALVIFAFAGLTSGTFASMKDIIATFSTDASEVAKTFTNATIEQS